MLFQIIDRGLPRKNNKYLKSMENPIYNDKFWNVIVINFKIEFVSVFM